MQARNADAHRRRWRARDACAAIMLISSEHRPPRTTAVCNVTWRAAADSCVRDGMNDAADAGCTFCNCASERVTCSDRRSRQLACKTLASRVVFARPGCYVVVQGVVSGFLTDRWLLPFSKLQKAGSHNLSIYPCVLTSVGSNMRESSGDSQLTLYPMYQAKTARCAAIGAPWAAQASNSAL